MGRTGGDTGGDRRELDELAGAIGVALPAPLVAISLATTRDQEVVGWYEAGGERTSISATVLCRQVVSGARPVIVHDVRRRITVAGDELAAHDVAGYAGVPIVQDERTIGAVAAIEHRVRAWSERDVELLRRFAEVAASALQQSATLQRERAQATLLVAIAQAHRAADALGAITAHLGWPRAAVVKVDAGRVRTIVAHGDVRQLARSWPLDADPIVREALRSGEPIWQPAAVGLAETPAFAVAIPESSCVLELFRDDASGEPDALRRIAPALASLLGALLHRTTPKGAPDRRTGELEVLALHDELTGLLNRRGFYAVAGGQLALARRTGMPGMLIFVDVDGLKLVNDREGHAAGDSLLRRAASVLRTTFREADSIARMGGDEFVVFSIDATDQDVHAVTGRLSDELARANRSDAGPTRLDWSVGHVCFEGASVVSLDNLVLEADRRMYEIKRARQHEIARSLTRPG